jgi:hypothetical protein
MNSLTHVAAGRPTIWAMQIIAPAIGTQGTPGVRNGRGTSGETRRRMMTPMLTSTNAKSVPMLTS